MSEMTKVIGPKSWGIRRLNLWKNVDPRVFSDQLEAAAIGSGGAYQIQLGPREWWLVSEHPLCSETDWKAAQDWACVVDISAAFVGLTLNGRDAYRTLSRIGNAHERDWLARARARRIRLADCGVVVLPWADDELTVLVARSEVGHIQMAIQQTLSQEELN